jgi:hypothetical protein
MPISNYIEHDIEKIKKIGKQREDKNFKFHAFLKGKDPDKIEEIVHRLYNEISLKIDCLSCGNCCIEIKPHLTKQEIKQISQSLNITTFQFKENYTEIDEEKHYIKNFPSSFFDGKKCSVYNY